MALGLLLVVWPALLALGPPRLVDGDVVQAAFTSQQIAQMRAVARPVVHSRAAILEDAASGQPLFGLNPDQRLAQASTTKIMTALVALSLYSPQTPVRVSARAASIGGSSARLVGGEVLPFHDMLFGLLLPSGNDAAVALAEDENGGEAAFVERMNARALTLGLRNSHFRNPDGLDEDGHYSTATDLASLARAALGNPEFATAVRTADYAVAATALHRGHDWHNLNELLGTYPGSDGVKTGTTQASGQVLVGSATREGHRLVMVVMGSENRYADARTLLDYGFEHFVWLQPRLPAPVATRLGVGPEQRVAFDEALGTPPVESWLLPSLRPVVALWVVGTG